MITIYKDIQKKYLDRTLREGLTPHKREAEHEKRLNRLLRKKNLPTRNEVIFGYFNLELPWWGEMMKYIKSMEREGDDIVTLELNVNIDECYVGDAKLINEAYFYPSGERDYWYIDSIKPLSDVLIYLREGKIYLYNRGEEIPKNVKLMISVTAPNTYRYPEILIHKKKISPENIKAIRIRKAIEVCV